MTKSIRGKVLLTAAGPSMRQILEGYTLPTFRRFAAVHGYEVVVVRHEVDGQGSLREVRMLKPRLVREQLDLGAELVLWIDADAMFLRFDADPADLLGPEHFQGLVLERVPSRGRTNPNSGVWLIRNVSGAIEFLESVERIGLQPGEAWADQAAIMRALGWFMGDRDYAGAHAGPGTPAMLGTALLPLSFNTRIGDGNPKQWYQKSVDTARGPHIWHLSGLTPDERIAVLRARFG